MALFNEQYFKETTQPKLHLIFDKAMTSYLATTQQCLNEAVDVIKKDADELTNLGFVDPTGLDSLAFEKFGNVLMELLFNAFETWKKGFIPPTP